MPAYVFYKSNGVLQAKEIPAETLTVYTSVIAHLAKIDTSFTTDPKYGLWYYNSDSQFKKRLVKSKYSRTLREIIQTNDFPEEADMALILMGLPV